MPLKKEESKWKKRLFTAVILLVLGSSIIGFTFSAIPFGIQESTKPIKYNGIEFFPTQNGISTSIGQDVIEFTYLPEELADVETGGTASKLSSARMVYATSNPNSSLASAISGTAFDIGRVLEINYGSFMDIAFTIPNPYGKSVITCNDATPLIPVILFNFTNTTTSVTENNNCIIISAASETSLNRVRDKIIYELLGVIA